jgi:hypothetical protein
VRESLVRPYVIEHQRSRRAGMQPGPLQIPVRDGGADRDVPAATRTPVETVQPVGRRGHRSPRLIQPLDQPLFRFDAVPRPRRHPESPDNFLCQCHHSRMSGLGLSVRLWL